MNPNPQYGPQPAFPGWSGWTPPPPPPPQAPLPPGLARRRLALVGVAMLSIVGLLTVAVIAAGHRATAPLARTPAAIVVAVEKSVVNINGKVADGTVSGTGMVLTADGIVLTNNHVIAGTTSLTGQVDGTGTTYDATVLGVDPTHDVAVIQLVGASGLPVIAIETSGVVSFGDHVVGMGNALGHNGAPVSASGVVTSLDDTLTVSGEGGETETLNGLIQFDARIQPGDSGGPLLNAAGRVIGMDTAGADPAKGGVSRNFGAAIPINSALAIVHQIRTGATSPYIQSGHSGSLGVQVRDAAQSGGALVGGVKSESGAAAAGIARGDVIIDVAGDHVGSVADLGAAMKGRRPGDHVAVTWHDGGGHETTATVTLSPGPPA